MFRHFHIDILLNAQVKFAYGKTLTSIMGHHIFFGISVNLPHKFSVLALCRTQLSSSEVSSHCCMTAVSCNTGQHASTSASSVAKSPFLKCLQVQKALYLETPFCFRTCTNSRTNCGRDYPSVIRSLRIVA